MVTRRPVLAVLEATVIDVGGVVPPTTEDVARVADVTPKHMRRVLRTAQGRGLLEGPPWVVAEGGECD
jgi:hypothetical protein